MVRPGRSRLKNDQRELHKGKKMKERKFSPRSLASKNYLMIFKREFSSLEVVIVGNSLKCLNERIIRNLFKNI